MAPRITECGMNGGGVPTYALCESDTFSDARLLTLLQPRVSACSSVSSREEVKRAEDSLRLSDLWARALAGLQLVGFAR